MTLYRETLCKHGKLESHGPHLCPHGFDNMHVAGDGESACVGPIGSHCTGGSRTEVTIDYEASVRFAARSKKRRNSPGFQAWIGGIVDTALGIEYDDEVAELANLQRLSMELWEEE